MSVKLKKLADQVIFITGASSGIGLTTAESAAKQGAKVVLAARSGQALGDIVQRITSAGGQAIAVTCDVSDRPKVNRLAEAAIAKFGRIDTWVNNAGLGMYGRADETKEADARRLFDINFWGVVNGCQAALPHIRGGGGALITVGSEVSDAYAPLMSMYVATKHAVKGYIDDLRVEIEDVVKASVSLTLIQPAAVDTPFPQHARNYMTQEPKLPPPMIEPQQVADAILHAAVSPTREKKVGTMSLLNTTMAKILPSLADTLSAKRVGDRNYDEPPRNPEVHCTVRVKRRSRARPTAPAAAKRSSQSGASLAANRAAMARARRSWGSLSSDCTSARAMPSARSMRTFLSSVLSKFSSMARASETASSGSTSRILSCAGPNASVTAGMDVAMLGMRSSADRVISPTTRLPKRGIEIERTLPLLSNH